MLRNSQKSCILWCQFTKHYRAQWLLDESRWLQTGREGWRSNNNSNAQNSYQHSESATYCPLALTYCRVAREPEWWNKSREVVHCNLQLLVQLRQNSFSWEHCWSRFDMGTVSKVPNIARGPGYWVYNLNYLYDCISLVFIFAAEITQVLNSIPWVNIIWFPSTNWV